MDYYVRKSGKLSKKCLLWKGHKPASNDQYLFDRRESESEDMKKGNCGSCRIIQVNYVDNIKEGGIKC